MTGKTDWDRYYQRIPVLARLTRRYTRSVLLENLRRHATTIRNGRVIELGGGDSLFASSIIAEFSPREYHAIDTNKLGLEMLRRRAAGRWPLFTHMQDVLALPPDTADVVFSVGLIEHFGTAARREAILAHLRAARSKGCVIISFPIATRLYRLARAVAEHGGWWQFHDETPVRRDEVVDVLATESAIAAEVTLWPIVLTQHMVVAQRK